MDLASLEPALKIIGVLVSIYLASKLPSDLRLNRVAQKKHVAELIQEMTGWLKNNPDTHPMLAQAKFHAAFGGSPTRIPNGQEILDFLKNDALATLLNAMEYTDCLEFVAYSKLEGAFIPRLPWTLKKLRWERRGEFFLYMVTGVFALVIFGIPGFEPGRLGLILPAAFYAVIKASRSGLVGRAEKLLTQRPTQVAKAA